MLQVLQGKWPTSLRSFLLYGLNGVLNTVVSYAIFFVLAQFIDYRLAIVIAYTIGACQSYLLNRAVVFRRYGGVTRFAAVSVVLMLANITITWFVVATFGIAEELAQLPAIAFVYVVGYVLNNRFVFSGKV